MWELLSTWIEEGEKRAKERGRREDQREEDQKNKAGYTATLVACGWAGAIIEVSGTFGQEQ